MIRWTEASVFKQKIMFEEQASELAKGTTPLPACRCPMVDNRVYPQPRRVLAVGLGVRHANRSKHMALCALPQRLCVDESAVAVPHNSIARGCMHPRDGQERAVITTDDRKSGHDRTAPESAPIHVRKQARRCADKTKPTRMRSGVSECVWMNLAVMELLNRIVRIRT